MPTEHYTYINRTTDSYQVVADYEEVLYEAASEEEAVAWMNSEFGRGPDSLAGTPWGTVHMVGPGEMIEGDMHVPEQRDEWPEHPIFNPQGRKKARLSFNPSGRSTFMARYEYESGDVDGLVVVFNPEADRDIEYDLTSPEEAEDLYLDASRIINAWIEGEIDRQEEWLKTHGEFTPGEQMLVLQPDRCPFWRELEPQLPVALKNDILEDLSASWAGFDPHAWPDWGVYVNLE